MGQFQFSLFKIIIKILIITNDNKKTSGYYLFKNKLLQYLNGLQPENTNELLGEEDGSLDRKQIYDKKEDCKQLQRKRSILQQENQRKGGRENKATINKK